MAKRSVSEVLKCAKDLLVKKGWIQRSFHREGEGYCLLGAVRACTQDAALRGSAEDQLYAVIPQYRGYVGVVSFNDTIGRRKSSVLALLNRAIKSAQKAEKVP